MSSKSNESYMKNEVNTMTQLRTKLTTSSTIRLPPLKYISTYKLDGKYIVSFEYCKIAPKIIRDMEIILKSQVMNMCLNPYKMTFDIIASKIGTFKGTANVLVNIINGEYEIKPEL